MIIDQSLFLTEEAEKLRWFLLPSEAQKCLLNETTPITTPSPFNPRLYDNKDLYIHQMKQEEEEEEKHKNIVKFHNPPKCILKPTMEVCMY